MRGEKYERRKKQLIGVFISLVMISSVLGFAASSFSGGDSGLEYEGHRFSREANQYSTKLGGQTAYFNFLPQQVNDIDVPSDLKDALDTKMIYVTYDPNSLYSDAMAVAQYTLEKFFADEFDLFVSKGVNNESAFDLPIITCDDATEFTPVFNFVESNNVTSITFDGSCATVMVSSNADLYKVVDRLRYLLYGVLD